ncbi:hypothetical protein Ancab_026843 [Ancistrocladus abbreviatus]
MTGFAVPLVLTHLGPSHILLVGFGVLCPLALLLAVLSRICNMHCFFRPCILPNWLRTVWSLWCANHWVVSDCWLSSSFRKFEDHAMVLHLLLHGEVRIGFLSILVFPGNAL